MNLIRGGIRYVCPCVLLITSHYLFLNHRVLNTVSANNYSQYIIICFFEYFNAVGQITGKSSSG